MSKTQTSGAKPLRMAREPKSKPAVAAAQSGDAEAAATAAAEPAAAATAGSTAPAAAARETPAALKVPSKQAVVIALLRREDGALLADIVEATGWLPHTARAMLTGLRKKGHAVQSTKVDKVTRYSLSRGQRA